LSPAIRGGSSSRLVSRQLLGGVNARAYKIPELFALCWPKKLW
jgi:hypothetical protein